MQVPSQITFRNIDDTQAIETRIQEKIDKLGRFYSHITFCKVVVDVPEKRKHQGKLFNVRIDIDVPGKPPLVITRDLNEDLYVAIRDAFKAASRLLEEYARIKRGEVKMHQELSHGKIVRLFTHDRYGFIETPDGEEYYFQASNVLSPAFENLQIGDAVDFLESIAGDSLQALRVSVVLKNQ